MAKKSNQLRARSRNAAKFAKERVVGTGDGLGQYGLDGGMRDMDEELVPVFSTELKKELLEMAKQEEAEEGFDVDSQEMDQGME